LTQDSRQRYIECLRKNYFGFVENEDRGFDIAPFWSGYPDTVIYTGVADDQLYRKLLRAQVVYNHGNVGIAGLVRGLSRVFDGATVRVTENGNAHVRVSIGRRLTRDEKTLLTRMPICVGAGIEAEIDDVPNMVWIYRATILRIRRCAILGRRCNPSPQCPDHICPRELDGCYNGNQSYKQFNFLGPRTDMRLKCLNYLASVTWQQEINYSPGQLVRIATDMTIYQC